MHLNYFNNKIQQSQHITIGFTLFIRDYKLRRSLFSLLYFYSSIRCVGDPPDGINEYRAGLHWPAQSSSEIVCLNAKSNRTEAQLPFIGV